MGAIPGAPLWPWGAQGQELCPGSSHHPLQPFPCRLTSRAMHWDRRCAEGFRPPPSPPVRHAVSPVPTGTLPPQVVRALLKRGSHPWKVALSGRIPELSSTADDKNLLVGCSTDCSWCEKKAFCPSGGQGWQPLSTTPHRSGCSEGVRGQGPALSICIWPWHAQKSPFPTGC